MILLFEQEEYVTMQAGIGGWSGGSIFAQTSAAFCLEPFLNLIYFYWTETQVNHHLGT